MQTQIQAQIQTQIGTLQEALQVLRQQLEDGKQLPTLKEGKITTHKIRGMMFGNMTQEQMRVQFSDGTILGRLIEYEIANAFAGFTKEGVKAKDEAVDLLFNGQPVQCKSIKMKPGFNTSIVQSCLFDTRNGIRRTWQDWDAMHEAYFDRIDYLLFCDTARFSETMEIDILFVKKETFKQKMKEFTKDQANQQHANRWRLMKNRSIDFQNKNIAHVKPNWTMPVRITEEMWAQFK